ncbi:hypothetical protein J6590_100122 [Homalodisca vitripennis]|nr:hypothetical protein J6590_100122 [Homalodisca vitripennis]
MVASIIENAEDNRVVGNRGNRQYLPDIVKKILEISPLIPTWTSIMVPIFEYGGIKASSAAHISSIEGAMKIAAAKEKDDFSKDMLDVTSDREVEKIQERIRESREKENWRGLVTGVESGKRKHSSYLQPNTEITLANMSSARALVMIGLLKN